MSERLNEGEDAIWGADFSIDPLRRIEQMARARRLLEALIESAVREARTEKRRVESAWETVNGETRELPRWRLATWAEIGDAAGLTRQGASKKYAHTID